MLRVKWCGCKLSELETAPSASDWISYPIALSGANELKCSLVIEDFLKGKKRVFIFGLRVSCQ